MQEKQAHPELKLICVIPFAEQARGWAMNWAFRYRELLRNADQIVLMCSNYQRGCFSYFANPTMPKEPGPLCAAMTQPVRTQPLT